MSVAIGIDLGTTNSLIAHLNADRPEIIPNRRGERLTPSAVFLPDDGGVIVGQAARERVEQFPDQTVVSIKRRMGTDHRRTINGRPYSPEEISAMILSSLKADAEAALLQSISQAVITVPANFNSTERQATKSAGEIAGLEVIRVLNEPTAAALAYGQVNALSQVVVVFDLGGGTFDISVVLCEGNVYEVLFSCGDNRLGGDDFNMRILSHLVDEARRKYGLDLSQDKEALRTLRREAIAAKHALSTQESTRISVPDIGVSGGQRVSLDVALDRPLFKTLVDPLLVRLRGFAQRVAAELSQKKYRERFGDVFGTKLEKCDVILVGGETRVACVRDALKDELAGKMFSDLNPDEVVALGAAVQAGILQRHTNVRDIVLVDSTSLSLGTQVKGGGFSVILPANTPIPARRTREYFTAADNQTSVRIDVFQGESSIAEQNKLLGAFDLEGLPARPKGEVALAVTFDLDANDILNVEARMKETGLRAQHTIKGSQTVSPEEVVRMKRDAAERDHQNTERLRLTRYQEEGEEALRSLAKMLRSSRALLHPAYRAKLEEVANGLRGALASRNVHDIQRYFYDLMHEFPKTAEVVPSVGLRVSAQTGFREGEWSRLEVVVENNGNGAVHDIQVELSGAIKEPVRGAIAVLSRNTVHTLPVSIFPTNPGSAVPLQIALEFHDESGLHYLVTTSAIIEVARREEPVAQDRRMLINIGEIISNAGGGNVAVNNVRQRIAGDNVAGGKAGDVVATRSALDLGGGAPPVRLEAPEVTPEVTSPPTAPPLKPSASATVAESMDAPITAGPAPDAPCAGCGMSNPPGFKFCGGCGAKLETKKLCAGCGIEVPPGMKFCGNCGAKVL